ncbi:hypothetical protein GMJAKD_10125 [Candidatus Electrothrix aarhusensis]
MAQPQDSAVDSHERGAVLQRGQGSQHGLDTGDIEALGNAEEKNRKKQGGNIRHKGDKGERHGIEDIRRHKKLFFSIISCQPTHLRGSKGHSAGHTRHNQADKRSRRLKGLTEQKRKIGEIGAIKDNKGNKGSQIKHSDLALPYGLPDIAQIALEGAIILWFWIVQCEQDKEPHRKGEKRKEKRILPVCRSQEAAKGRVTRHPQTENTGVIAHCGVPLSARIEVTDQGDVKCRQGCCPGSLKESQEEEQMEILDQSTGSTSQGEEEQGRG